MDLRSKRLRIKRMVFAWFKCEWHKWGRSFTDCFKRERYGSQSHPSSRWALQRMQQIFNSPGMALFFDRCSWSHNLRICKSETQCIVLTTPQYIELKLHSGEISRATGRVVWRSEIGFWEETLKRRPHSRSSKTGRTSIYTSGMASTLPRWESCWMLSNGPNFAAFWMRQIPSWNAVAYAEIIWNRAIENWKRQCLGCETEDPCQHAHSWLSIFTDEAMDQYVSKHGTEVHVRDIIVKAAIEAQ